ncbi:Retrovirus-related Pol polyprotein from transposon TNT 1-94 [Eumeta japonica]|uniref:Retrovirus-related Pol polyprotein from transposon TNT 1-94 n=1 Tax=Eumeta variegata TaxID=151549 RepID=A0A4C1VFE8_EUMVA|nr:Retrovirus-related Pol polyprotein from transposon TNT 1-94 [Eumeta japonica]
MEPKSYLCMANVPQTYEDALSSEDSELWIKSIKEELKAHEDNGTWELVKKPDNVRLLDCKEAVGSLMFAAIVTRPDIMFAVSTVSRFLNSHDQSHWNAVKKIFKYLKGTLSFGLCFRSNENNTLESYSDADYANDPVTRRSTTGYVFMKMEQP